MRICVIPDIQGKLLLSMSCRIVLTSPIILCPYSPDCRGVAWVQGYDSASTTTIMHVSYVSLTVSLTLDQTWETNPDLGRSVGISGQGMNFKLIAHFQMIFVPAGMRNTLAGPVMISHLVACLSVHLSWSTVHAQSHHLHHGHRGLVPRLRTLESSPEAINDTSADGIALPLA